MKIGNFLPQAAQAQQSGRLEVRIAPGALEGAKNGDVIEAKVLSQGEGSMSLQLEDGSVITASRSAGLRAAEGESITLTVLGRQGAQLVARMDSAAQQAGGDPAAILAALELEQSETNKAVVSEFLRHGLSPTRETVEAFSTILKTFESASPREVSFLLEQNIPVTAENAQLLKGFCEGRHQLGDMLSALAGELSALEDGPEGAPAQAPSGTDSGEQPAQAQPVQSKTPQDAKVPAGQAGALPEAEAADTARPGAGAISQEPEALVGARQAGARGDAENAGVQRSADNAEAALPKSDVTGARDGAVIPHGDEPEALPRAAAREPGAVNAERGTGASDNTARASAQQGARGLGDTSPHAAQRADGGRLSDMIRDIYTSLKDKDPALLAKELDAGALKQKLEEALTAVRERAASLPEAQRQPLMERAREIADSAKFISDLNGGSAFVQLPIMLGGKAATADLYVFGEKKKKDRIDPKNATVFVSLDTVSLGKVEAFVKVIGDTVECDFSLGSKETASFFQHGGQELLSLLEAAGYRLTRARFSHRDRPSDLIDVPRRREAVERRYALDVRI